MNAWEERAVEGRSLAEYWLSLYRRKWVFVLMVASALAAASWIGDRLPKIYETRVVFFVPSRPPALTFYGPDAVRSVMVVPKEPVAKEDAQAIHLGLLKSDSLRALVQRRIPAKSLEALRKDVDFQVSNEFTLQVYARDRDPAMAAQVANGYMEAFEEQLQENARENAGPSVLAAIEEQMEQASARVAKAREALQRFEEQNQTATMEDYITRLGRDRGDTERLIDTTRIALAETDQRLASLKEQVTREGSIYSPQELTTTSPLAEALRKDLADLEATLAGTRTKVQEKHPDVKGLQAQMEDRRLQLRQEIERIVKAQTKPAGSFYETLRHSLTTTLVEKAVLGARIKGNEQLLRQIERRIQLQPEIKKKYSVLTNEVIRQQALLDGLRAQQAEAKAQQASRQRISVVVDWAKAPEQPSFPIPWLNMLVAGALGILGGLFYCAVLDYAQRVREARRRDPYRMAGRLLMAEGEDRK